MTTGVSPLCACASPSGQVCSVRARPAGASARVPSCFSPSPFSSGLGGATRRSELSRPFGCEGGEGLTFLQVGRGTHTHSRAQQKRISHENGGVGSRSPPPRFLLLRAAGHRPALEVTQSTFGARSDRTFDPSLFCYCSPEKSGRKREYGRTSPL